MGKDRIALGAALLRMGLMGLTIAFRVNPVEGSVIAPFLRNTTLGFGVLIVLLVTCMPVWLLVLWANCLIPLPFAKSWLLIYGAMIFLQGFVYFWFGKLLSVGISKLRQVQRNHRAKS
jgi:hypothetical protein